MIFVIPTDIAKDQSALKGRVAAAEQLRARFSDCDSGLPLARSMDNVAVRDEIIRDLLQLGEQMKQLLDKTPTGHLTPPSRSPEGIEMIAVCGKSAATDDSSIRAEISQQHSRRRNRCRRAKTSAGVAFQRGYRQEDELRSSTPDLGHRMAPLALTRGDPSGIGPELALKAWLALHDAPNAPAFFVVANVTHLEGVAKRFALPVPIAVTTPAEADGPLSPCLARGRSCGPRSRRLGSA